MAPLSVWSVYCPHLLVRNHVFVTQQIEPWPISVCLFVWALMCVCVCVCVCACLCVFLHKEMFSHFHPLSFSLSSSQWSFSHTYLLLPFDPAIKEQIRRGPLHRGRGLMNFKCWQIINRPVVKPTSTVITVCWPVLFISHRCSHKPQEGRVCDLKSCGSCTV